MDGREVVARHEESGRRFIAAGVGSFVLDAGSGEPVVCLHGVPASSFLYRKLVPELAARGLRGIAFDLPGLGFAERPAGFDYTWTGLGRFEVASEIPQRVASLTILNTLPVEVDTFRRPWSMQPFALRGLGPVYLRTLNKPMSRVLMRLQGVADTSAVSPAELDAPTSTCSSVGTAGPPS